MSVICSLLGFLRNFQWECQQKKVSSAEAFWSLHNTRVDSSCSMWLALVSRPPQIAVPHTASVTATPRVWDARMHILHNLIETAITNWYHKYDCNIIISSDSTWQVHPHSSNNTVFVYWLRLIHTHTQSGVTHANSSEKLKLEVIWKAPSAQAGDIQFRWAHAHHICM